VFAVRNNLCIDVTDFESYFCSGTIIRWSRDSQVRDRQVRRVGTMPSMQDASAAGGDDREVLMTMERPSSLVDSLPSAMSQLHQAAGTPTDRNGNNLPSITYADLTGLTTSAACMYDRSPRMFACTPLYIG